jgi:hypothetical protein
MLVSYGVRSCGSLYYNMLFEFAGFLAKIQSCMKLKLVENILQLLMLVQLMKWHPINTVHTLVF